MNMRLHTFFFELVFLFSSDKYPGVGLLDHMVLLSLIIEESLYGVSESGHVNLLSHKQYKRIPFFPHPHQHLLFAISLIKAILTGVRWYLTVVWVCIWWLVILYIPLLQSAHWWVMLDLGVCSWRVQGFCLLMGRGKPWGLWLQSPGCPGAGAFPLVGEVGPRLSAHPLVCGGFSSGSAVKNSPAMQETQVWSLGGKDPLKEGMATHSSILA